jgi:bacterioferritin-associated ferredoxin
VNGRPDDPVDVVDVESYSQHQQDAGSVRSFMYVCICKAVSVQDIQELVVAGASTVVEVMERTGAGTRCGTCRASVVALVEGVDGAPAEFTDNPTPSCGVRRLRMLRASSAA